MESLGSASASMLKYTLDCNYPIQIYRASVVKKSTKMLQMYLSLLKGNNF